MNPIRLRCKKKLISNLIFVSLPAIVTYFSKDDYSFMTVFGYLKIHLPQNYLSIWRFKVGLAAALLLQIGVYFQFNAMDKERERLIDNLQNYLKIHKQLALKIIGQTINIPEQNIVNTDVKVYLCKQNRLKACMEKLSLGFVKAKTMFVEKNIKEFGQTHYTELSFEVSPKPQGLLASCYNTKRSVLDKHFNPKQAFLQLDSYQQERMADVKFIACCPVFIRRKVRAVLVFESRESIWFDDSLNEIFCAKMRDYRDQLESEFPKLFEKVKEGN
ncbi:MAG TPA: hypothetical protein DDW50_20380 [Firmicutes bacterium]|jgi:hypothetical protein|nr:hypothetical protein [Bacillota bacterium]